MYSAGDMTKQPHDYALYYHEDVEDRSFAKHSAGDFPADVDLATINKGITHKRHLSDVFAIGRDLGYQAYHFAACRVRRE